MNLLKSLLLSLVLSFPAFAADSVNINSADAATMATKLNGIGTAKAELIVAYRQEHGPFTSVEQLADVKGIGLKTVDKNRELLSVGAAPKATEPKKGS